MHVRLWSRASFFGKKAKKHALMYNFIILSALYALIQLWSFKKHLNSRCFRLNNFQISFVSSFLRQNIQE